MAFVSTAMKDIRSKEVVLSGDDWHLVFVSYGWTDKKGKENIGEGYILLDGNGQAKIPQVINLSSARFYLNLDKNIQEALKVDINTRKPQAASGGSKAVSTASLLE